MTCKAISNVCSNFFSPLKSIGTCCPCGSTAIKVGAYFTVVLPLLFAVTWGGAKLCDYLFTEVPEVPVETQLKNQEFDEFMASPTAKKRIFVLNGNVQVLISFDPSGVGKIRAEKRCDTLGEKSRVAIGSELGRLAVISRRSMKDPTLQKLCSYIGAKHDKVSFYQLEGRVQLTDFEGVENPS